MGRQHLDTSRSGPSSVYARPSFWRGTAERAIKTAAQAALSVLSVGEAVWQMSLSQAAGIALGAALLSILTSLADPDRADTATATGGVPA